MTRSAAHSASHGNPRRDLVRFPRGRVPAAKGGRWHANNTLGPMARVKRPDEKEGLPCLSPAALADDRRSSRGRGTGPMQRFVLEFLINFLSEHRLSRKRDAGGPPLDTGATRERASQTSEIMGTVDGGSGECLLGTRTGKPASQRGSKARTAGMLLKTDVGQFLIRCAPNEHHHQPACCPDGGG